MSTDLFPELIPEPKTKPGTKTSPKKKGNIYHNLRGRFTSQQKGIEANHQREINRITLEKESLERISKTRLYTIEALQREIDNLKQKLQNNTR